MSITVKIEGVKEMQAKLDKFGKAVNKESQDILKEIARNGANSAASTTFPRGTTSKVRDSLHKAIYKDIIRSYIPVENTTITDDGSHLESKRTSKGRVPSFSNRKVISQASYESIRREKIRLSGLVKAAWLEAGNSIGAKNIRVPVWLRKDYKFGESSVTGNGWESTVTVKNNVKYSSNLITDSQLQRILTYSYLNYMKFVDKKMEALAKKV